jgi:hypothetical protein
MKVRGVDRKPCPRSDLRFACVVSQKRIPIALPFMSLSHLCSFRLVLVKKDFPDMTKSSKFKFKKPPEAPRRFKSSYMFFSTVKHREIRATLEKEGRMEKVSHPSPVTVATLALCLHKNFHR